MTASLLLSHGLCANESPAYLVNALKIKTLAIAYERYEVQGNFNSIVIPIKRAGKLILIDAYADSVSGSLILDTGSAGIVLNQIYFRNERKSSGQQSGGITGKLRNTKKTKIKKLSFDEIVFENIMVDLVDLGHLEKVREVKILGFFGLCLFRDFELVLDLKNNVLELHRLNDEGWRLSQQPVPVPDLELEVYNYSDVFFVEGRIANRRLIFCLDTGAESNVLDSYLSDKILKTVKILSRSSLRGVGKQEKEVFYGLMNEFILNDKAYPPMQTIITNLSQMSDSYGMEIHGMLGCNFFEQGVYYLNMKTDVLGVVFHEQIKP
ncbi:MAG: hypothetical protein M0Q90_16285 [Bacteroidales bacterium]|nr:hypothetical protein [Bacteroidales bacterium]